MKAFTESKGYAVSHKFGDGPNWRMRVIRTACDLMDLDSEVILRHSFQRGLYALPLAENWKSFLLGNSRKPKYIDMPMDELVDYWKRRWLKQRVDNHNEIVSRVLEFKPKDFTIVATPLSL
jgi:hypothetical protein